MYPGSCKSQTESPQPGLCIIFKKISLGHHHFIPSLKKEEELLCVAALSALLLMSFSDAQTWGPSAHVCAR